MIGRKMEGDEEQRRIISENAPGMRPHSGTSAVER